MGRFEIGLASVMGVLVLGILVLINASLLPSSSHHFPHS